MIGRAMSRSGVHYSQEYIIILHIRQEVEAKSAIPFTAKPKSELKIYRAAEFVDARYNAMFFEDERKRAAAWREQKQRQEANVRAAPNASHTLTKL